MKYDKLYYEKVKPGDIFKNYKVLCPIFGFAPTTGKSRILQMNVIDSLIRYKKVGCSFHITEVLQPDGTWSTLETLEAECPVCNRLMPEGFYMFRAAECASDIRKTENMPEPYHVPNTVFPNSLIKTYKTFCDTMKIRYQKGDSKPASLKNIQKYLDLQQSGRDFKIGNIYVAPIEYFPPSEYSKRFVASRQHTALIEYMLISYLYGHWSAGTDVIISSKKDIMRDLNLILTYANDFDLKNELYNRIGNNTPEEQELVKKYYKDGMSIQYRLYRKADQLLQNALSSIRSKNLFSVHEKYYILEENAPHCRPATKDEEETIVKLQRAQMSAMGVVNMYGILAQKRSSIYYDGLRQKYLQQGWVTVKRELEFIPCRDFLFYHATDTALNSYRTQISAFMRNYMATCVANENESYLTYLLGDDAPQEALQKAIQVRNGELYQIACQPKEQCQSELQLLLDIFYPEYEV